MLPFIAVIDAIHFTWSEDRSHPFQIRYRCLCHFEHACPIASDLRTRDIWQVIIIRLSRSSCDAGCNQRKNNRNVLDTSQRCLQCGRRERHNNIGLLLGNRSDNRPKRADIKLRISELKSAVHSVLVTNHSHFLHESSVTIFEIWSAVVRENCDRWHCAWRRIRRCSRCRECSEHRPDRWRHKFLRNFSNDRWCWRVVDGLGDRREFWKANPVFAEA